MNRTKFYWHVHHEQLVEIALEPIKNRIKYIKEQKPEEERATRLRLLKPVKGVLPASVIKTGDTFRKVEDAFRKQQQMYTTTPPPQGWNWVAYDNAYNTYTYTMNALMAARTEHIDKIEALHAKECLNCPWNGRTIFP